MCELDASLFTFATTWLRRKLRSGIKYDKTYGASESRQHVSARAYSGLPWLKVSSQDTASHLSMSNGSLTPSLRPVCGCQQFTSYRELLPSLDWSTTDAYTVRLTFGCWCDMSPPSHQTPASSLIRSFSEVFRKCFPFGGGTCVRQDEPRRVTHRSSSLPYRLFMYRERLVDPGLYQLCYTLECWFTIALPGQDVFFSSDTLPFATRGNSHGAFED